MSSSEQASLAIERVTVATADAAALVDALERELAVSYSAEQRHGAALESLLGPGSRFYLGRLGREAVACGGFTLEGEAAELKRMFVRADRRRRGIAIALLRHLVHEAAACGAATVCLETGVHQPAAMALYERLGFRACPPFGRYRSMPPDDIALSRFFVARSTDLIQLNDR